MIVQRFSPLLHDHICWALYSSNLLKKYAKFSRLSPIVCSQMRHSIELEFIFAYLNASVNSCVCWRELEESFLKKKGLNLQRLPWYFSAWFCSREIIVFLTKNNPINNQMKSKCSEAIHKFSFFDMENWIQFIYFQCI
jgi:hypothetical protein